MKRVKVEQVILGKRWCRRIWRLLCVRRYGGNDPVKVLKYDWRRFFYEERAIHTNSRWSRKKGSSQKDSQVNFELIEIKKREKEGKKWGIVFRQFCDEYVLHLELAKLNSHKQFQNHSSTPPNSSISPAPKYQAPTLPGSRLNLIPPAPYLRNTRPKQAPMQPVGHAHWAARPSSLTNWGLVTCESETTDRTRRFLTPKLQGKIDNPHISNLPNCTNFLFVSSDISS